MLHTLYFPFRRFANSIQVTLMQVMRLLVAGQIEHKTAGLLLYALQTTSVNLRHTEFEPTIKEHVVMYPREIPNASLGAKLWDPDDYEDEEEEYEEDEDEKASAEAGEEQLEEGDDAEESAASPNPGKKPPQQDPHYNHPIRVEMRKNPAFKAAIAEVFRMPVNHPFFDTMGPAAIDEPMLRDICMRVPVSFKRRE
jgi:hypothetical protein